MVESSSFEIRCLLECVSCVTNEHPRGMTHPWNLTTAHFQPSKISSELLNTKPCAMLLDPGESWLLPVQPKEALIRESTWTNLTQPSGVGHAVFLS